MDPLNNAFGADHNVPLIDAMQKAGGKCAEGQAD